MKDSSRNKIITGLFLAMLITNGFTKAEAAPLRWSESQKQDLANCYKHRDAVCAKEFYQIHEARRWAVQIQAQGDDFDRAVSEFIRELGDL
jgi:hypothetical protein